MTAQTLPYRPCVGIVVFNNHGLVWSGRRLMNPELAGSSEPWQFPQGGIDKGEDFEAAARRELYEETGITSITPLGQTKDWLYYTLPEQLIGVALKGKFCGQKQHWFAYLFTGDDKEIAINPPPDGHKAEFDAWEWIELEDAIERIVPFKKALYKELVAEFAPIRDTLKSA